jgi:hypothetical protein
LAAYRIPGTWFFAVAPDAIAGNNMKKGRFFISPLTVISIETLEDLESAKADLRSVLVDYSAACQARFSASGTISPFPSIRIRFVAANAFAMRRANKWNVSRPTSLPQAA